MSMIQPISSPITGPARASAPAGAKGAPEVQRPAGEAPARAQRPAMDEYIPEEKREPSGAPAPVRKAAGDRAESCTGNTDQVDRKIERLKQKKETLERQLSAETGAAKAKGLEQKLAQVERELAQKDNDAYRRRHTVFS